MFNIVFSICLWLPNRHIITHQDSHVQTQERSKPYSYTSIHKLHQYI